MSRIESSIIIPVYNKWDLSRQCLKSLADTTDREKIEVIVIDNASTDVTPQACAFLGKQLFGTNFKFIRNEVNRNFAAASNQGAESASGEFLLFLNNDTQPEKGWYEALLNDFRLYPNLAATGPLLVYPEKTSFGRLVQHLGVLVSPFYRFGHLYQGIPENSPLAKKRRFFQAITAACLLMKKHLFLEIGKFDERYINGFEDMDLCGRLSAAGYNFTVNPEAKVVHYEGQSPGRGKDDGENYKLLSDTSLRHFRPDWQLLAKNDGLGVKLDAWVNLQTHLVSAKQNLLDKNLATLNHEELKVALVDTPYWQEAWEAYLTSCSSEQEQAKTLKIYFKLFKTVPNAARLYKFGKNLSDKNLQRLGKVHLSNWRASCEELRESALFGLQWCERIKLPELARQYQSWLENYESFKNTVYPRYMKDYFSLIES